MATGTGDPSDEDREALAATVRRFLAEESPESEVRRLMAGPLGYDPRVWDRLTGELGLSALVIPRRYGGAGYSWRELAVVLAEMGAALLCSPYFATVALAANLLLCADDQEANSEYLPRIAHGAVATVALAEAAGRWDREGVAATAAESAGRWLLTGEKHYVLAGHTAEFVLVVARTGAGFGIFAVEGDAPGFRAETVRAMDETRKLATLFFDRVPGRPIGDPGSGWAAVETMLDLAAIALAAEQAGGAGRVLDMAVGYAKTRVQFGRPIGSFQAIKHKCADVLLEVELARTAAAHAAEVAAACGEDLPALASLAKSTCSAAYTLAAEENIQIHGGIGYTWEHPAHLYFRRAKSSELLFGDVAHHREQLARRIGV